MTFHLHIGAHKTATTHLQATLKKHREILANDGVVYQTPETIRALTERGRRASVSMGSLPSIRRAAAARRLLRLDKGAQRLVASDENSLGQCVEIFKTNQIYPNTFHRLLVWRRLVRRNNTTIYLAIRDYGPFFSGAYVQAIRNAPFFEPGDAELSALSGLPRRWPDVVADIRRALPTARLVVWRFEDYPSLYEKLIAHMTGHTLAPVNRRPMATPSAAAFAAVQERAKTTRTIDKTLLYSQMETAPVTALQPAFSLWSEAMAASLNDRYQADVKTLSHALGEDFIRTN